MSLFYACALSSEWGLLGALRSECNCGTPFLIFSAVEFSPAVYRQQTTACFYTRKRGCLLSLIYKA